jgi:hypothetical protein
VVRFRDDSAQANAFSDPGVFFRPVPLEVPASGGEQHCRGSDYGLGLSIESARTESLAPPALPGVGTFFVESGRTIVPKGFGTVANVLIQIQQDTLRF